MIDLTVAEIAAIVSGSVPTQEASARVLDVVVDSREASVGSMFVAITGEHADGHDFAEDAREAGAVVVLAERQLSVPCIVVVDPVVALGVLAQEVRRRLTKCTVIAITGSSGKTSTKDLLAGILAGMGPTVAPLGSFNTEVGVPLTILRATSSTQFLVVEMGMRGIGHIEYLCQLAEPTVAVLLNIGSAHLGMLQTREQIAQAKGEIIASLPVSGLAVLNGDDALVRAQATRTSARLLLFGMARDCEVRAEDVQLDDQARASFALVHSGQSARVQMQVHGAHLVANALAVAAVLLELGMGVEWIAKQLSASTIQSRWRMEVSRSAAGVTIVNDTYNANPESMAAALRTVAAMGRDQRRWAVLGEMLELGAASGQEHATLGRLAAQLQLSRLVCVGEGTMLLHEAAAAEPSWRGSSSWVPDAEAALALLSSELQATDIVLIKASRGIGLERLAAALGEWEPQ